MAVGYWLLAKSLRLIGLENWNGSETMGSLSGFAGDSLLNLLHYLGMQRLTGMEWNNDSPGFFSVDSMATLTSYPLKTRSQKKGVRLLRSQALTLRQP